MAGQRIWTATAAGTPRASDAQSVSTQSSSTGAKRRSTESLARGVGGLLRPFRRIGGVLWLEVTGVFFFLPVVVFAPTLWRTRSSFFHGPDHRTFLASAVVVVIFFYLGVTSFWRARRHSATTANPTPK
jgi:hypothetical protein